MNEFQREIYKTIDILVENKLKELGFDKTRRGKVILPGDNSCIVEIDGEEYTCKVKKGIRVAKNDVVQVEFPQNNSTDRYVKEIISGDGSYSLLEPLGVKNGSSFIFDCGLPNSISNGLILDGGGVDGI